jgi:dTDP-3-amino-3,4,6-trideoxy-alpha-D-glucose transaminase
MVTQIDFARQWEIIGAEVLRATERVGASGRYILGKEVEVFEDALARGWGVRHAVGVGNGMDALEIALRCLDLRAGEKVLTTPFSAFATTLAILRAGGVPVFVDVDDNGNIDLEQCRAVLAGDRSIRVLVPVHLYGNPLDLDQLAQLGKEFGLRIVEDCAQAIGASARGRAVGTVGQLGATSFYPTKNLGALGDGGAVLTNDPTLASRGRALRNYGQSSLYQHDERGLNSRLDELQAAILSDALLPKLQSWTERRREIAERYRAEIHNPALRLLTLKDGTEPAWHIFPLFTSNRERLQENLAKAQIGYGIHYPRIIPDQAAMKSAGIVSEIAVEPANARRLARSELSLPIHPFLRDDEIEQVIVACNGFVP